MNVCIEILEEQIGNMKENYFCLIGGCQNMLEFSNYTIMNGNKERNYRKRKVINNRIRKLYEHLLAVREDIIKL